MKIAVIKYNAGNVYSMKSTLERLKINPVLTDDPEKIMSADKVIFPGVGEAGSAMEYLKKHELDKVIKELSQPFLGVCLGLQLLCRHTEENNTDCLNLFNVSIKKFPPKLKVPQIGWNSITFNDDPLFAGIKQNEYVYFVHSYYAKIGEETISTTDYIIPFSSAIRKNNFYGVQFHPEKSGTVGENIIKNFIEL